MTSPVRQRRGASVDAAVLDATLDLLAREGYAFSVDQVAAAAGVHKTTVYRRWETKALLVAAAVARLSETTVGVPHTTDPLEDLDTLAAQVAQALAAPAGRNAIRATLAAAGSDPELADAARDFFASRYAVAHDIIRRAQADGSIRPDLDATLLWQAVVNPMHLDAVCGLDTSPARARDLVRLVLDGARPAG